MSYARLHHDHQSRDSVSKPRTSLSDTEDDIELTGNSGREDASGDVELQDFSHTQDALESDGLPFDPEFEEWQSDAEKGTDFSRERRASASTVHSFMLYTPDEEKSVIRKFDKKLVLFVALLYMLSFLDRSSMCRNGPFAWELC